MQEQDGSVSFERDIRPLFRDIDIDHMADMEVYLDDYDWMSDANNAKQVYDYLTGDKEPQMPPGGPYWSQEQLGAYSRWMGEGRKP